MLEPARDVGEVSVELVVRDQPVGAEVEAARNQRRQRLLPLALQRIDDGVRERVGSRFDGRVELVEPGLLLVRRQRQNRRRVAEYDRRALARAPS